MTKTSLPGCMQSVLVSCPYEVWGPSQLCQPHPGLPFPEQRGPGEEGLEEGGGGDSCPHPVLSCLALMETSHTHAHSRTTTQTDRG